MNRLLCALIVLFVPSLAKLNCQSCNPEVQTCIIGVYYPITRLDGNNVRGYSETTITGVDSYLWSPYITGYMFKDSTQVGQVGELGPGQAGGTQSVTATATLSYWGTGTYSLTALHRAYNWYYGYWVPPYSNGWNGYSYSNPNLTVQRPTVSRGVIPYYLGGEAYSNDYSSVTQLSADPKGAPETPQWSFVMGGGFGTLSCTNCSGPTFQATSAGTSCGAYNVGIKANFNGFDSETLWLDIQVPYALQYNRLDQIARTDGWESHVVYKVFDACLAQMTNVKANEVFTQWQQFNGSNWNAPLLATGWPNLYYDSITASWTLVDVLYEIRVEGKVPQPYNTGANGYGESSTDLMTQHFQEWRIGSTFNGGQGGSPSVPGVIPGNRNTALGVYVGSNQHYHYKDHGRH